MVIYQHLSKLAVNYLGHKCRPPECLISDFTKASSVWRSASDTAGTAVRGPVADWMAGWLGFICIATGSTQRLTRGYPALKYTEKHIMLLSEISKHFTSIKECLTFAFKWCISFLILQIRFSTLSKIWQCKQPCDQLNVNICELVTKVISEEREILKINRSYFAKHYKFKQMNLQR